MSVIDCVKGIETDTGIQKYDYESLANLPVSDVSLTKKGEFADGFIVGQRFNQINSTIDELKNIIDTLQSTISQLQTNQQSLTAKVTALENKK